jgi:RsiW-degrading membrane proteinase PrsW (M82 family)
MEKIFAQVTLTSPIEATSIPEVIRRLTNFFFTLALYLLPVIIVIGGVFIITAAGNPEQIEKGKKIIILGLIGFIILLTASGIIALIRQGLQLRNP